MNAVWNLFGRLRRDRRGGVAIMMAGALIMFAGFGAVVIDIGYLYQVRRTLQSSADMAALAGAQDINCCSGFPGQAITTAISYSAVSGNHNATPGLDVTMPSGYPALRCFTSITMSCSGPDSANGIVVVQQVSVPLFFARIFGNDTLQVSVTSVAGKGGTVKPADVMLILDTTLSMNSSDTSCSGATRLNCAFGGFRTLLSGFSPAQNRVGLMVFPGVASAAAAAQEYDCDSGTPGAVSDYNASPVYQVVSLSNDYQNTDGSLNANSSLVKAARGSAGCPQGVTAIGGVGTYYGDAITAAKTYLTANARPEAQKIIILLSDGDANRAITAPAGQNACRRGITLAQQAKDVGISIIAIAYGAPTGATPASCPTDASAAISACATLQQIASDASMFYSDTVGGTSACTSAAHAATDLSTIFQDIVTTLSTARLLPEGTT